MKICAGPSASKSLVLENEKAPRWRPGPDVTAKGWKEAMWAGWTADLCRQYLFSPANMSTQTPSKSYSDSMESPGSRGTYPDEKYVFRQIQRWPALLKLPSGCWQNFDFRQICRHIRQTLICLTSLSYMVCRRTRLRLTQIWPPYFHPSPWNCDWLAAVYICKTCCSFHHCHEAAAKKN